jgi:hypothetical protein
LAPFVWWYSSPFGGGCRFLEAHLSALTSLVGVAGFEAAAPSSRMARWRAFLLFSGGPCGGSTLRPVALARGGCAGAASA